VHVICQSIGKNWGGAAALLLFAAAQWASVRGETYCVSTLGDDAADGRSEKTAWRTIAYAAKQAKAGDTVLVAPGDYGAEQVVFANSGEEGKPIVVKGHGGRPQLKSDDKDNGDAFLVSGKAYIHIEGFDIYGYGGSRIKITRSSHCQVRDVRCLGWGGCLNLFQGVEHSWVDSCYVEDTPWNAIMVLGTLPPTAPPSPNNTVSNCTVVRPGHGSIDIHTNCPDTYMVGCVTRERGKEKSGKPSTAGFYVHNAPMARPRLIGNASTAVWSFTCLGVFDGLMADNLLYGTLGWGITNERSSENAGVVLTDEKQMLFTGRNVIADNICFDVPKRPAFQCYGSKDNVLVRNYADGKSGKNPPGDPDYDCDFYRGAESTGNAIVDPINGHETIRVRRGTYELRFTPGFDAAGTRYRLSGDKTAEAAFGPDGAAFGVLAAGNYALETNAPGTDPGAPQYLRAAPLVEVEGGAVLVWRDRSADETGFVVERRQEGEKEYKELAKVAANATRYIDKEIGRKKACYRVRSVRGDARSEPSNEDEVVRYGYWFTNRTGLAVDGFSAFAQVETGELKTLIVEKAKRVERKGDWEEGQSALELLETCTAPRTTEAKRGAAKGEAKVWLAASKPVTATLRWRAGSIRGHVEGEGEYTLELDTGGRKLKEAWLNCKPAKCAFDGAAKRARLEMSGSGYVEIALEERR
jgi:hypothetical protein